MPKSKTPNKQQSTAGAKRAPARRAPARSAANKTAAQTSTAKGSARTKSNAKTARSAATGVTDTTPKKGTAKSAEKTRPSPKSAAKAATKAATKAPTKTAPRKASQDATGTSGKARATRSKQAAPAKTAARGKAAAPDKAAGARAAAAPDARQASDAPATPATTGKAAPAAGRPRRGRPPKVRREPVPAASPEAEDLRQRFSALASATGQISGLKRAIGKNFFDVGVILNRIRDERLYEVKGYGSFEAFVERELELNKVVCMRSARIAETLHREAALEAGLDRASAAVAALDGEDVAGGQLPMRGSGGAGFSVIPLHKQ